MLILDEATSALDTETAEHFGSTIRQLRGHVRMLFITRAVPKSLQPDRMVRMGEALPRNSVGAAK